MGHHLSYLRAIFLAVSLKLGHVHHFDLAVLLVADHLHLDLEKVVFALLLPARIDRRRFEYDVGRRRFLGDNHVFLQQTGTVSAPHAQLLVEPELAGQIVFEEVQLHVAVFVGLIFAHVNGWPLLGRTALLLCT